MNVITLLGAAVGSQEFYDILSTDPAEAARLLNLVLTQAELNALTATFVPCENDDPEEQERKKKLAKISDDLRAMLCKRPPCPSYTVALPKRPPVEERLVA